MFEDRYVNSARAAAVSLVLTIAFLLGFSLLAVHNARCAEPYHFAFSKKQGVDVYVVSDGMDWCQRLVEIQIRLAVDSPLLKSGIEDFFRDQVGPLLNAQCPSAERVIIIVVKAGTGQQIATIRANRADGWNPRNAWTDGKRKLAIVALGGFGCVLLGWAMYIRRRDAPRGCVIPHIVTAPGYYRRLGSIPDQSAPDNGGAAGAGLRGEAAILKDIKVIGGGIVYWGLGLSFDKQRCEFDILVMAPHSLLHVEVKNLCGKWRPDADSVEGGYATKWFRQSDGTIIKSPITQANRARFLLGEAARAICAYQIPVHSVVVVANDTFEFAGEKDDRVKLMRDVDFREYYESYANGPGSSLVAVAKPRLARLPLYLMHFNQLPVCFDLRSFGVDRTNVDNRHEWTDEDYVREFRCQLMEAWNWDKVENHNSGIWFGSSEAVHPDNKPPEGYV